MRRVEAPTSGVAQVKSGPLDARTPLPLPFWGWDGVALRVGLDPCGVWTEAEDNCVETTRDREPETRVSTCAVPSDPDVP